MEVEIYRVILTVEERKERLTMTIAKQLPILDASARWKAAENGEPQPEPICKITGRILRQPHNWMYLVRDPVAGLGWIAAMQPNEKFAEAIVARGGWIDHPENVPTAIL